MSSTTFPSQHKVFEHIRTMRMASPAQKTKKNLKTAAVARTPVLNAVTPSNPDGWVVTSLSLGSSCSVSGDEIVAKQLNTCIPVGTGSELYNYDSGMFDTCFQCSSSH